MTVATALPIPTFAQGFARSRGESAHPELWNGSVGLYAPMLGPTGRVVHDWSGQANHGDLINGTPASDWVSGEQGWAVRMTAPYPSSVAIVSPRVTLNQAAGSAVVRFCRRVADAANASSLLHVNNATNTSSHQMWWHCNVGLTLLFVPNTALYGNRWDFGFHLNDLPLGRWVTLAATWDNSQICGYLDGKLTGSRVGSGAWPSAAWTEGERLILGTRYKTVYQWPPLGDIGAFYLFDRPLPANTIAELHENLHAPLLPARRLLRMRSRIGGPYRVEAGATFVAGVVAGGPFAAGAVRGETLST